MIARSTALFAVLFMAHLLLVACARPSASAPTPTDAPRSSPSDSSPPRSGDAGESAEGDAPDGPRPLGRKQVPIRFERRWVGGAFAQLASPSPEHPRGTIVVVGVNNFREQDSPTGPYPLLYDVVLIEIDLATAAQLRAWTVVEGAERSTLLDGTSGPIVLAWKFGTLTLVWFDRSSSEVARHTHAIKTPYLVPYEPVAIGDRVAMTLHVDSEAMDLPPSTPVWLFDAQGGAVHHVCPGTSYAHVLAVSQTEVFATLDFGALICAFRADGTGTFRTHRYPFNTAAFFVAAGQPFVIFRGSKPHVHDVYALGDDLNPKGEPIQDVPRDPSTEVTADQPAGDQEPFRAKQVNGTMVLWKPDPFLHEGVGPAVLLYDPGAPEED